MGPSVDLFIAASSGNEKEVARLIKPVKPGSLPLFINSPLRDRAKDTPLLFMVVAGDDYSPLYSAAHYRIAIMLLNAGADPLQTNNRYECEDRKRKELIYTDNSLFKAISKGDLAMTRLLLSCIKDLDKLKTVSTLSSDTTFNIDDKLYIITKKESDAGNTRNFKKLVEDTLIAFKAIRATKKAIKDALIEGEKAKTLAKAFVEEGRFDEATTKVELAKTHYLKAEAHYHELVKLYGVQIELENSLVYEPVYSYYDFECSGTPAKPEEYRPVLIAYYKDKILKANLSYFEALKGMSALDAILVDIANRSRAAPIAATTFSTETLAEASGAEASDTEPLLKEAPSASAVTSASFLRWRPVGSASGAAIAGAGVRH